MQNAVIVTPELRTQYLSTLTTEEVKDFNGLKKDKQDAIVEQYGAIIRDVDVVKTNCVSTEEDDLEILGSGKGFVKTGFRMKAQYLGRTVINKLEASGDKSPILLNGQEVYRTEIHEFRRTDGKIVRMFGSPMLNNALRALPTLESGSGPVDPVVELEYFGLLDKATLEKDWDFPITRGKEGHAWTCKVEEGLRYNKFAPYCVNYLNNPHAITGGEKMDARVAEAVGFQKNQERLAQIGAMKETAQIAQ